MNKNCRYRTSLSFALRTLLGRSTLKPGVPSARRAGWILIISKGLLDMAIATVLSEEALAAILGIRSNGPAVFCENDIGSRLNVKAEQSRRFFI
jgi:hypothetical protein